MNNTELLNKLLSITIWMPINGYDNYMISICGQVRNAKTKRILIPRISKNGYYRINLCKNNEMKTFNIHQLVAKTFIPNIRNDGFVDHINGEKLDNTISNLRWCSCQQNQFNRKLNKDNTSGIKGVSWDSQKKKWKAQIQLNNKNINIGLYDNLDDAKLARQQKAAELFGEFLNDCEK